MNDLAAGRRALPVLLTKASSMASWVLVVGGLVLLACAFTIDWLTGPGLSMLLGYGAITAMCGFVLPHRLGTAVAGAAVAAGTVVSVLHPDAYLSVRVAIVNAVLRLVFFVALARGAALLHQTIAELDRLAHTDSLSGLLNRRAFLDLAEHERRMAIRRGTALAVVAMDLDGLKRVNDEQGHEAGDAMLAEFSTALAGTFRATDVVARVGGDEFAAVLPDTDLAGARILLGRLSEHAAPIAFSGGVVSTVDPSASLNELMRAADDAMYRAKRDVSGTAVVGVELNGPEAVDPQPAESADRRSHRDGTDVPAG